MSGKEDIKSEYLRLANLPESADGNAKRQRGFAFEKLLRRLFTSEELEPRIGYRKAGEQIDGSFYLDGRIYLLEAKWHADPLPASTLYQFKGKVDGKLTGTIGVFISMSGYAEDAVDALTLGKALNLILFDGGDIHNVIIREAGFKDTMKLKLRKAAEEGAIFFPSEGALVNGKTARTDISSLHFDQAIGSVGVVQSTAIDVADLLIVCEAESDRAIIAALAQRILSGVNSTRSIKILTAMGKVTIPRVANAVWNTLHSEPKVLIVSDGDGDPAGTRAMLENGLAFQEWVAVVPNPSIEVWLGLDAATSRRLGRSRFAFLLESASEVDIEHLRAADKEFSNFYDIVVGK